MIHLSGAEDVVAWKNSPNTLEAMQTIRRVLVGQMAFVYYFKLLRVIGNRWKIVQLIIERKVEERRGMCSTVTIYF